LASHFIRPERESDDGMERIPLATPTIIDVITGRNSRAYPLPANFSC
jgi:hypothetical protein